MTKKGDMSHEFHIDTQILLVMTGFPAKRQETKFHDFLYSPGAPAVFAGEHFLLLKLTTHLIAEHDEGNLDGCFS